VVIPGKEKYIQASWQKEIFSVDLFFSKARFFRFLLNSSLLKRTPLFPERIAYTVARRQSAQSLRRRRERLEDRMRELELLQRGAAATPIMPGNDPRCPVGLDSRAFIESHPLGRRSG
jgi:hypothetical protein